MAIYLKQLFAPDAPVTEEGVAQARQLGEADSEPKAIAPDESEELNFDRRTSFTMRVEAAPAMPRPSPATPLAAAPMGLAPASPAQGREADGEGAGLPPTSVGELPPELMPRALRSVPPVDTLAPAGGLPIAAAPGFDPRALSPEAISPKAILAMAGSGQRSGGSGWLILVTVVAILLTLLGVGAMVFVGTK